jgi:hypothetical protein
MDPKSKKPEKHNQQKFELLEKEIEDLFRKYGLAGISVIMAAENKIGNMIDVQTSGAVFMGEKVQDTKNTAMGLATTNVRIAGAIFENFSGGGNPNLLKKDF